MRAVAGGSARWCAVVFRSLPETRVPSVLPKKGLAIWCNASVVDKGGERSRKRSRGQKPWLLFVSQLVFEFPT